MLDTNSLNTDEFFTKNATCFHVSNNRFDTKNSACHKFFRKKVYHVLYHFHSPNRASRRYTHSVGKILVFLVYSLNQWFSTFFFFHWYMAYLDSKILGGPSRPDTRVNLSSVQSQFVTLQSRFTCNLPYIFQTKWKSCQDATKCTLPTTV